MYYSLDAEENVGALGGFLDATNDDLTLREHLDRRFRERHPELDHDRPRLPTFEGWKQVPSAFKTRDQWLRAGRRVQKGEQAVAKVIYPRWIEPGQFIGLPDESRILERLDDLILVTNEPTKLYHLDQTAEYFPTPRMLAYWAYEDIFFAHSRRDSFICKTDRKTKKELDGWYTETAWDFPRDGLTRSLIRQHINQVCTIGGKGTDLTRYVVIDLDFHGRDPHIFERQAEILVENLHGREAWHYDVGRHEVWGVHFVNVFPRARKLEEVVEEFRSFLRRLDRDHSDLADAARNANMPTFGDLEIYPHPNKGVRLPLGRDRVVLLDKPLPLITYRKKLVQDVEYYTNWLANTDRRFMNKERILDYVHYLMPFGALARPNKPGAKATTATTEKKETSDSGKWRRNLKKWLPQFWVEGHANGRQLNEHIAVLCRLAHCYGHSKSVIVNKITEFLRELPDAAKSCSSRLARNKIKQVEGVVKATTKYVSDGNGHQQDPVASSQIFERALEKWPGFDPLDKKTWALAKPVERSSLEPAW